jgi:5'-3' exonuclease|tara:strand:- start:7689 stop:8723 length:1035 start_codon:yes stop_codon:yes gene_type:complete
MNDPNSLLKKYKESKEIKNPEPKEKRYLIIDALNAYFRAYIVDPSVSTNGQPIGGVKGFLKILQKLARETKPDMIVVAWDGPGGSKRKRIVNKGYKEGRSPIRLNRGIQGMLDENQELENKIWQQTRLVEYLNNLPVSQVMIDGIEADDVIAYIVQEPRLKQHQKVIVSSDKDFFQLCDGKTVLLRPIQKEVLNTNKILEKFDIHPTNFALSRAVAGDKSDNLPGVPGVGLKTLAKKMTFLAEDTTCTVDDLIEFCKDNLDSKLKLYNSILENEDLIRDNYKIMQLYAPNLPINAKSTIRDALYQFDCTFNKTEIIKMMNEDGFGVYDWSTLWQTSQHIVFENC